MPKIGFLLPTAKTYFGLLFYTPKNISYKKGHQLSYSIKIVLRDLLQKLVHLSPTGCLWGGIVPSPHRKTNVWSRGTISATRHTNTTG